MPVSMPFEGYKRWHPWGPCSRANAPPLRLFLPRFYCPLLSFSLPKPHPGAEPKTITFLKLLLAFPDLLPQAQKETLLAGLVRAWLGPQSQMVVVGEFCWHSETQSCPASRRKGVKESKAGECHPVYL